MAVLGAVLPLFRSPPKVDILLDSSRGLLKFGILMYIHVYGRLLGSIAASVYPLKLHVLCMVGYTVCLGWGPELPSASPDVGRVAIF